MSIDSRLRAALAVIALAAPLAAQSTAPAPAPSPAPAPQPAPAATGGGVAAYEAPIIAAQLPSYPMNSCLACGKIWGPQDTPLDMVRQGRLVRVCGPDCVKAFDAQVVKWFKVLDDQIIAAQSATYPLTQCPVTGETLAQKPKLIVVGTRLVKVCCGDCKKELLSDTAAAAAALKKIDEGLIAAQSIAYPAKTCLVDDKPVAQPPVQMLYGVTLVRFCSGECEGKFKAAPQEYSTQLEALRRSLTAAAPQPEAPKPGEAKPGR